MAACLLWLVCAGARGQANEQKYSFQMERMPLVVALNEFSRRTGLQLGYLPNSPADEHVVVGPLKGRYTIEAALTRLLHPKGLTFSWVNDRTVSIVPLPKPPRRARPRVSKKPAPQPVAKHAPSELLEGVTVEAGRLRYVGERAVAVQVFNRGDIERVGVSTVAELMKYVSQQTYLRPEGFRATGAQYAELRGLGADMTLVLINGRRTLASAGNFISNAFDLNTVPISAVERVEVLPQSASAVYGTDAIAGIVNIVLRDRITQPTLELHYGTAEGGAAQRRMALSTGYGNERVKSAVVLDYFDLGRLSGAERALWRDQDYRRFGSVDQRSLSSSPGNIAAAFDGNLPGLPASHAAVPPGAADGNVTIDDFLPTAGLHNYESLLRFWPVVPQAERMSAAAAVEVELASHLFASVELLYADRSVDFQISPPILAGVPVPATNAYNPFGTTVLAHTLLSDISPQLQNVDSQLLRVIGSMRGRLDRWEWELALLSTQDHAAAWLDNALDFTAVAQALAQPDPSLALNVFEDGPAGSPQVLAGLLAPRDIDRFVSDGMQAAAFVHGSLLALPAGEASILAGMEWRRETAQFDATVGSLERDVGAGFAELRIPLSSASQRPWLGELTLTAGARLDDYSDFGSIFNPQYGLIWHPRGDLTVRLGHGRSFRPPSMYELFFPRLSMPGLLVADPRRDHELATVTAVTGGNTGLAATRGDSTTLGIEFSPAALQPLHLAASYWQVEMQDRVTLMPLSLLLANEPYFAERIVREAPSPADAAAGRPGRLRSVDVSRMNFGRLATRGVDLSVRYDLDTALGRWLPGLSATWVDRYVTVDLPSTPARDRVAVADVLGTIARWRVIATLGWQRGAVGLSTNIRYVPGYEDALDGVRTGRNIDAQTIVDLQATLDLDGLAGAGPMWRGVKLTAGASNLLDAEPPFAQVGGAQGFDTSQADLKGRFCYLRVGRAF